MDVIVDKTLAKDVKNEPLPASQLREGEIGIGVYGVGGGGVYVKIGNRVIGLQTSTDFTNWAVPIMVQKLPRGTVVTLFSE